MTRFDLEGGGLVPREHGEWVSYGSAQAEIERLHILLGKCFWALSDDPHKHLKIEIQKVLRP